MAATSTSGCIDPPVGPEQIEREDAVSSHVFPFLRLPRELRDQVCISATLLEPSLIAI
jgi:hypothetical protein